MSAPSHRLGCADVRKGVQVTSPLKSKHCARCGQTDPAKFFRMIDGRLVRTNDCRDCLAKDACAAHIERKRRERER